MFYKVTLEGFSSKGGLPYIITICPEANNEEEAESKAKIEVFKELNKYLDYHNCGEVVSFGNIKVEKLHD